MSQTDSFLHTTHRTVSWFNKSFAENTLELAAPFQRNPVWTNLQKAYLVDTILHGLPIPELYMQDLVDETGAERHIVVDGQQRIRAVLEFVGGEFTLEGTDVTPKWRGLRFETLSGDEKKLFFSYKFVVRVLPSMDDEGLRRIFARLNRNVVALNEQELRNATYWGPFIQSIQKMADDDPFWASSGIFSANDHRRMLDHEFISELAVAFLHGPQNKKERLDHYYRLYEAEFDDRDRMEATFRTVTAEISKLLPALATTRWRKRSDFYTLFLTLASRAGELPWAADKRTTISRHLVDFGSRVDRLLGIEEDSWAAGDEDIKNYARAVSRAASDRASRVARQNALKQFLFGGGQGELVQ
ncbi:MAG TPA: DUF262 domain-containing protein [Terriglobia bacterium]|nr:DUF262 domain-containing protein [Terriglobia bacterium]